MNNTLVIATVAFVSVTFNAFTVALAGAGGEGKSTPILHISSVSHCNPMEHLCAATLSLLLRDSPFLDHFQRYSMKILHGQKATARLLPSCCAQFLCKSSAHQSILWVCTALRQQPIACCGSHDDAQRKSTWALQQQQSHKGWGWGGGNVWNAVAEYHILTSICVEKRVSWCWQTGISATIELALAWGAPTRRTRRS